MNHTSKALRKHAILRSNIIEAAWVAIRKDETMQLCYLNNCKRMVPSKAIVKVARKLVNRIYFVYQRISHRVQDFDLARGRKSMRTQRKMRKRILSERT